METQENDSREAGPVSSGPLRILAHDGKLLVTGFGLRIPVKSEEEGREVIRELEDQGYRICY